MEKMSFRCKKCGRRYVVPFSAAGRRLTCRSCGALLRVPAAPSTDSDQKAEEMYFLSAYEPLKSKPKARRRAFRVPPLLAYFLILAVVAFAAWWLGKKGERDKPYQPSLNIERNSQDQINKGKSAILEPEEDEAPD